MADLAENAPSALLGIVHPMIGGDVSGIHAIVDGERFVNLSARNFFICIGHGREATIEADHQRAGAIVLARATRRRRQTPSSCQFAFIQAERLFAENRFARAQGCERLMA